MSPINLDTFYGFSLNVLAFSERVVFKAFDSLKAGSYPQMSDFVCPNLLSSVILKDFFEQEVLSSEIGKVPRLIVVLFYFLTEKMGQLKK